MNTLEIFTILTVVNTTLVGLISGLVAAFFLKRGETGYPGPMGPCGAPGYVVCPKCGNYVGGHATGSQDLCTCHEQPLEACGPDSE